MLMILNTIAVFKMFTVIESLTEGGPAGSTTNLVYLIQQTAFNDYSLGYAFTMVLLPTKELMPYGYPVKSSQHCKD